MPPQLFDRGSCSPIMPVFPWFASEESHRELAHGRIQTILAVARNFTREILVPQDQ
jgi:hypothetical protein